MRSSLFIAVVSLFVLTGFAYDIFDDCCGPAQEEQKDHGQTSPGEKAPGQSDGCQCVCHQIISHSGAEPVRVAAAEFVPAGYVLHADEFPPDAEPLGIDYPPQLA